MEEFKNILVVTHSIKESRKAIRIGISLARKYDGKVHLLHVIHDPFNLEGWNIPVPSFEEEYRHMVSKAREELLKEVVMRKAEDLLANIWVKDGRPRDEIQHAVESEHIDVVLIPAHPEGRLEHFLFGKENDTLIRKLPATLMLVK